MEMTIPRSRRDVIFYSVTYTIVVFFVFVAVFDLLNSLALITPCIWLAYVAMIVRSGCRSEGGLRKFLINRFGDVAGRQFADVSVPREIRFGYELFGKRFIQRRIALDKIESVEWSPGQATSMAGRDMKDWLICLWVDHDDPIESQKRQRWARKPDQDVYIVGPSRRKEDTGALGLSFIAFIRDAGVTLVPSEKATCFVRSRTG